MNARRLAPLVMLMAAAPLIARQTAPVRSSSIALLRPTFRATADVVPVHVSVRTDRSVVNGLTAADFELHDNGVRQEITAVSADSLAVDVTLVVDTSGSVVRSIGRFKSDVRDIVRQLRKDEQPGHHPRLVTARRSAGHQEARNRIEPLGQIALGDLLRRVELGQRVQLLHHRAVVGVLAEVGGLAEQVLRQPRAQRLALGVVRCQQPEMSQGVVIRGVRHQRGRGRRRRNHGSRRARCTATQAEQHAAGKAAEEKKWDK